MNQYVAIKNCSISPNGATILHLKAGQEFTTNPKQGSELVAKGYARDKTEDAKAVVAPKPIEV